MPNKSKIEWCDYTSNIIIGKCPINCEYCWANKLKYRFNHYNGIPLFNKIEFLKFKNTKLSGKRIFVNSTIDAYADSIDRSWMQQIIEATPTENTIITLTKEPKNLQYYDFPVNWWVGVTITNDYEMNNINFLKDHKHINKRFACFEPLLKQINPVRLRDMLPRLDWIIVGGLSPRPVHEELWINDIVCLAKTYRIPIFIKKNAKYKTHFSLNVQEYPK